MASSLNAGIHDAGKINAKLFFKEI